MCGMGGKGGVGVKMGRGSIQQHAACGEGGGDMVYMVYRRRHGGRPGHGQSRARL